MRYYSVIFLLLCALSALAQPKYEVRAVWLATIGGIDWPTAYAHGAAGAQEQQRQLCDMLDRLQALNVNTILLQTRVRATTIYPSEAEPFDGCLTGQPGLSPGYDPLLFAIDQCHRRGMELHAWVVTIPIGKWGALGCRQLRKRLPRLVKRIGDEGYLNPENPQTADYLADLCADICRRYDVDGIHLDYIRYPETWRGPKSPHHITRIVERIHQRVKAVKPWVKLSSAPIGKYDDLSRYTSRGWNARRTVAQDAQQWLRDGLMDQLYPMMYFRDNHFYPFAIDWHEQSAGRTIVAGLGTYMLHPREGNWPLGELQRQLAVSRQLGIGHCSFRARFVLDDVKGIRRHLESFDRHPALIPPMTWAGKAAPTPPATLDVCRLPQGDVLTWGGATDHSGGPYLLYNIYASTRQPVDISDPANLIATRHQGNTLTMPRGPQGESLYYAVTALDRYGSESATARQSDGDDAQLNGEAGLADNAAGQPSASHHPTLLVNDGATLAVPRRNLFDAKRLIISDLQGRPLLYCANSARIDISALPDGVYLLRAQHRKGYLHRLGTFIIRR